MTPAPCAPAPGNDCTFHLDGSTLREHVAQLDAIADAEAAWDVCADPSNWSN